MKRLDASVISSAHGDSLLRFLDLPVHQVTKVWSVNLKAAGGRSISMHKLDRLVTDHLMKRR